MEERSTLSADIKALVPRRLKDWVRSAGKRTAQDGADLLDRLASRHDPLVPPRRMWAMVGSADRDFAADGQAFVQTLIDKGALRPDSRVLDIGCGIGKHAGPFARYLDGAGAYYGLDVDDRAIRWCRSVITRRHSNIQFERSDVINGSYNPDGSQKASDYRLPFADAEFDLVFLASVFTHMNKADVSNYVGEIHRVLKPGGRAIASAFLINPRRRASIARGVSAFNFSTAYKGCWIEFPDDPEIAVAFDEDQLLTIFSDHSFDLAEPVCYGIWSDQKILQGQDLLIHRKRL